MSEFAGILLLGGSGNRFGSDIPKQFCNIAGKPVYQWSLDTMVAHPSMSSVIIVVHSNYIHDIQIACQHRYPHFPVQIVTGGQTRQESVRNGLSRVGEFTEYVMIHDGARPFLTTQCIDTHIKSVATYQAVMSAHPISDTLFHSNDGVTIASEMDRTSTIGAETPQTFAYSLISHAHELAQHNQEIASDDASLVLRLPHPVHIVYSTHLNLKITSPMDKIVAEAVLQQKGENL